MDRYPSVAGLRRRWGSSEWRLGLDGKSELVDQARGAEDDRLDASIAGRAALTRDSLDVLSALHRLVRRPSPPLGRILLRPLAIVLANALKARGVAYGGDTEQVRVRMPRATPCASYRHALAVERGTAGGSRVLGGSSALRLGGARPTHQLPRGIQFGRIACSPSRSGRSSVAGEDALLEHLDVADAMADARVGRRHESRGGACVLVDGGRPLTAVEWRLVELVDHGRWELQGGKRGGHTLERVKVEEAIEVVRQESRAGRLPAEAAALSLKEARKRLKAARRALEESLRERGLIPEVRRHRSTPKAAASQPSAPAPPRPAPVDIFVVMGLA